MRIDAENETVTFEQADRHFVDRFGPQRAEEMVLDYSAHSALPFLYDTYQLAHFLGLSHSELFYLTNHIGKEYHCVLLTKKNGATRRLYVPGPRLKRVQRIILNEILQKIPVSPHATAYRKGHDLLHNAAPHTGKPCVLKMDLTDFFDSISFQMVYSTAFNTRYFPKNIGTMLTVLCTRNHCLPQGAPTSPILSNIALRFFDDTFGAWCDQRYITYTRYSDDITCSGATNLYPAYRKARGLLDSLGFEINERKTKFCYHHQQQKITGIVVNDFPQISSDYRRALRQEMYFLQKYGIADALVRNPGMSEQQYLNSLRSKVAFVLQVHPESKEFIRYKTKLNKK